MSALTKLDTLQQHLDLLERNSQLSGDNTIPIDQIKQIRKSVNQLSNDLKEELKSTHRHPESYRTPKFVSNNTAACEEKTTIDEETLNWLDTNFGGDPSSVLISPKRTPLQRFRIMGGLVKDEIKDCRKFGLDTKNLKGLGFARMSVAANSSLTLANISLAVPRVNTMLEQCWDLDQFDIFEFAALPEIRGHVLMVFGSYLLQQFSFMKFYHIPKDKIHNFLVAVEQNYNDVPYHNKIHAADVMHTMSYFCMTSIFKKNMSELDKLCCFIAAVIHDVGHTGQTNNYHINSKSILAIRYNDRSVLENYHLSTAFQLLRDPNNNFLKTLTKTEYKYVRETVIEMVLGTDLFYHQKQLKKLQQFTKIIKRQNIQQLDFKVFTGNTVPRIRGVLNEKRFIMGIQLHLSDISNPTKPVNVSIEWTKRITQEFFAQGDMERVLSIQVSPGCDRNINRNMAKQSIAFIDFIVHPIFTAYNIIDEEANQFIEGLKKTRNYWQSKM
eukprot:57180_1